MALADFVAQYNDKGVDYDGWAGDQCVDLVNFWSRYIGSGSFSGPTALNLVAPAGWVWTANTPQGVPPAGAVVKYSYSPSGHVSISLGGTTTNFRSFDQNWNGIMRCEQVTHDYSRVLGWWTHSLPAPIPVPIAAPANQTVTIKSAVNVRTQPNTSAPIAGALHPGYCVTTGSTVGASGTVGAHTSTTWYKTLNGNWFCAAATL